MTLERLRGQVVLIDFWTYSCINCLRTLPYITEWDERYRDAGRTIVGVHSPEFAFEREEANVRENVFLVLTGRGSVEVLVDGERERRVRVAGDRLYTLVERGEIADHELELRFSPGVAAYAFTFG